MIPRTADWKNALANAVRYPAELLALLELPSELLEAARAAARSFPLFRLQDALDAYAAMDDAARARADALLDEIGGVPLKTYELAARLTRTDCRLALA